jgi:hypothetical protein
MQVTRETFGYSHLASICSAYVPCRWSFCNTVQRDDSGPRSVCRWTYIPQPAMLYWALVFMSLNMYTRHCNVALGIGARKFNMYTTASNVILGFSIHVSKHVHKTLQRCVGHWCPQIQHVHHSQQCMLRLRLRGSIPLCVWWRQL